MFENVSQGLLVTGYTGYYAVVPIMKIIAGIFMAISIYRDAKSRKFRYKWVWMSLAFVAPILGRLAYSIYHRYIRKWIWKIEYPKAYKRKGVILMVLSVFTYGVMLLITVISVITMGASFIKSAVDNEPLGIFYDVKGNEYYDVYEVPLYDREDNVYYYDPEWFVLGDYVDQKNNRLDGNYCFLDSDGYLVYDESNVFTECQDNYEYFFDEDGNMYYGLWGHPIYMEENGDIYEFSGRYHILLFEEEEDISSTYSREYVEDICSGWGFGDGSLDDTYIVAQHIYASKDFKKLYGENFAIEYISGSAEFESSLKGKQGTSYCRAHIGEDIWAFNLTIDYGEDWQITDYHLEEKGTN